MKTLNISLLLIGALAIGGGVYAWEHYSNQHPSTDDAYVEANTVNISPQLDGQVVAVPVHSYQTVKKGDVLLRLDDSHDQLAVQQAQAALTLAQDQAHSASATTRSSTAQAAARQQEQANAALDNQREQQLIAKGLVPRQEADDARFKLKESVDAAAAAQATIASVKAQGDQASAQTRSAQLALAQAQLGLSHTVITAPADGILGEVNVQPGDFVNTGEDLFPMVDTDQFWVAANFKETDLTRIKAGQTASISLDMYPQHRYQGEVETISPASGAAFSLLPAQNATGNWVKVTQRFPIRIRILDQDKAAPLRVGSSVSLSIDTSSQP